jgi:CCR4-NOT transcription complex subunit 4
MALVEDVRARREAPQPAGLGQSPFPDFDRTLQVLGGNDSFGGFSFNLDPKLAGAESLLDNEGESQIPFKGTYLDAFPGIRAAGGRMMTPPPPGLSYPHNPNRSIYDPQISALDAQSTGGSSGYLGSFDPFADGNELSSVQPPVVDDGSRKVSRFGFARGKPGPSSVGVASPLMRAMQPSPIPSSNAHALYSSGEQMQSSMQAQWAMHGYGHPISNNSSPLPQHAQPNNSYVVQQPVRNQFQSHEPNVNVVSESQLRDFIQSSRDRAGGMHNANGYNHLNGMHNRSWGIQPI